MYPNALHVPPDEVDAAPKPIQLAAGLGCATSWKLHDAGTFSLRWITRDADAVIDLLGGTRELAETVSDHPQ
ncbi:MAG: hypothetical protein ACRDQI_01850 [Pseudonocardiaceae bacterium]